MSKRPELNFRHACPHSLFIYRRPLQFLGKAFVQGPLSTRKLHPPKGDSIEAYLA